MSSHFLQHSARGARREGLHLTSPKKLVIDSVEKALDAKGLLSMIYEDTLRESATQIGHFLRYPILPVVAMNKAYDWLRDLPRRVHKRLEKRDAASVLDPPETLLIQIAAHAPLTGDEETLRSMYEGLLATSMDPSRAGSALPSFASVIHQLSPAEARFLESVSLQEEFPWLLVSEGKSTGNLLTLLSETGVEEPHAMVILHSLVRLGILSYSSSSDSQLRQLGSREVSLENEYYEIYEVSPFGTAFIEVCVR